METLRRLYARLRLRINEAKSAVARPWDRKFLGYSFWVAPGRKVKRRVAPKALEAMKQRIRELTARNGGRAMKTVFAQVRSYLSGWKQYFQLADTPRIFSELDKWLRHRLRMVQLKQWKRGTTIYRELQAPRRCRGRGPKGGGQLAPLVEELQPAAQHRSVQQLLRPDGNPEACQLTSTVRTAGYGPVCPVVWEGTDRTIPSAPIPISRSAR